MRVTIVRDENSVVVDGVRQTVDCSTLPADVHVVQWYGEAGEIEHLMTTCDHCGVRSKKPNETIRDFSPYQRFADEAMSKTVAEKEKENAAGPQP